MTLLSDWIVEVESHVYGTDLPRRNRLTSQITGTATSMVFDFTDDLPAAGDVVSVGTQDFYVWAISIASKTATVEPLVGNAETHAAASSVFISPRVSRAAIYRALNEEMRSLSATGLFRIKTLSLTYSSAVAGYDFNATDLLSDDLMIDFDQPGPTLYWPSITDYRLGRDLPTTTFASGMAVFLHESAYPGRTIRVRYKAKFGSLGTTLTSDVGTDTGLHTEAHDIPPLGAAARLIAPQEVPRDNYRTQGNTRRADEVAAGAVANSGSALYALRQRRIEEEKRRLELLYPSRLG